MLKCFQSAALFLPELSFQFMSRDPLPNGEEAV